MFGTATIEKRREHARTETTRVQLLQKEAVDVPRHRQLLLEPKGVATPAEWLAAQEQCKRGVVCARATVVLSFISRGTNCGGGQGHNVLMLPAALVNDVQSTKPEGHRKRPRQPEDTQTDGPELDAWQPKLTFATHWCFLLSWWARDGMGQDMPSSRAGRVFSCTRTTIDMQKIGVHLKIKEFPPRKNHREHENPKRHESLELWWLS